VSRGRISLRRPRREDPAHGHPGPCFVSFSAATWMLNTVPAARAVIRHDQENCRTGISICSERSLKLKILAAGEHRRERLAADPGKLVPSRLTHRGSSHRVVLIVVPACKMHPRSEPAAHHQQPPTPPGGGGDIRPHAQPGYVSRALSGGGLADLLHAAEAEHVARKANTARPMPISGDHTSRRVDGRPAGLSGSQSDRVGKRDQGIRKRRWSPQSHHSDREHQQARLTIVAEAREEPSD